MPINLDLFQLNREVELRDELERHGDQQLALTFEDLQRTRITELQDELIRCQNLKKHLISEKKKLEQEIREGRARPTTNPLDYSVELDYINPKIDTFLSQYG